MNNPPTAEALKFSVLKTVVVKFIGSDGKTYGGLIPTSFDMTKLLQIIENHVDGNYDYLLTEDTNTYRWIYLE